MGATTPPICDRAAPLCRKRQRPAAPRARVTEPARYRVLRRWDLDELSVDPGFGGALPRRMPVVGGARPATAIWRLRARPDRELRPYLSNHDRTASPIPASGGDACATGPASARSRRRRQTIRHGPGVSPQRDASPAEECQSPCSPVLRYSSPAARASVSQRPTMAS